MKYLFSLLCLFALSGALSAQYNAVDQKFNDYQAREDFINISISGSLFEFMAEIEVEGEDAQEVKAFMSSITAFNMLIGDEPTLGLRDYHDAISRVERDYEELMTVEDKDGTFSFRIDEQDGRVREFLMLGISHDDLIILSLSGDMDLALLTKVGAQIQADGFEYLEKMEGPLEDDIRVYPNPAIGGNAVNIVVPDEWLDGSLVLYSLTGKQVLSYVMGAQRQRIELPELPTGQYLLEFTKQGKTLSRKLDIR